MKRLQPLRRSLAALVAAAVFFSFGCGTLLHPERQGQTGGRVDPAILLLDGAMLFLFVVPGLVAFGVDFLTGAIYLPGGHGQIERVPLDDPRSLDEGAIEEILAREAGITVDLSAVDWQVHPLDQGATGEDLAFALEQLGTGPPDRAPAFAALR